MITIGTEFELKRGKNTRKCKVIDIWKTYSQVTGQLVKKRYVVEYTFLGQTMTDRDVLETTIKKALHRPAITG